MFCAHVLWCAAALLFGVLCSVVICAFLINTENLLRLFHQNPRVARCVSSHDAFCVIMYLNKTSGAFGIVKKEKCSKNNFTSILKIYSFFWWLFLSLRRKSLSKGEGSTRFLKCVKTQNTNRVYCTRWQSMLNVILNAI